MNGTDLVQIPEAADAFGISQGTLKRRLEQGAVPEAVEEHGTWTVPSSALKAISEREGWPLDLTGKRLTASALPQQLDRYISETMAAHAAVVLAKTQAAAAQAAADDLSRELRVAQQDLDAEMAERERSVHELSETKQEVVRLEKDLAVSNARVREVRDQVEYERAERIRMTDQVIRLERERDVLWASVGWWGRHRMQRQQRPNLSP